MASAKGIRVWGILMIVLGCIASILIGVGTSFSFNDPMGIGVLIFGCVFSSSVGAVMFGIASIVDNVAIISDNSVPTSNAFSQN